MDASRTWVEEYITDPAIDAVAGVGKKIVQTPIDIAAGAVKWGIGGVMKGVRAALSFLPIFPVKKD